MPRRSAIRRASFRRARRSQLGARGGEPVRLLHVGVRQEEAIMEEFGGALFHAPEDERTDRRVDDRDPFELDGSLQGRGLLLGQHSPFEFA